MTEDNQNTNLKPAETPTDSTSQQSVKIPVVRKKTKTPLIATGIVAGILLLLGFGVMAGIIIGDKTTETASSSKIMTATEDGNTTVTKTESDIAAVAAKVSPSVVSILTKTQAESYFGGSTSQEGAGTGIIVSKDGYVMTNNHVIQDVSNVAVVDSSGNLYESVTVVGRDPLNDVAFLKIKSNKEFTAATLGNSATVRTGQQVVAIGNALGQYSNTVTSGIISGTGRPITASTGNGQSETLNDLIQTDASINPGNSGGPLLNMSGQVIGINTAIIEDANGIGFSIPINSTKGVLAGVLEKGTVDRAFLGVNYVNLTPALARQYKLSVNQGAYVYAGQGKVATANGSPAEKAGLKSGDVITKLDDNEINSANGLSTLIGQYRPGDTITVTYLRSGETKTAPLTFTSYKE